MIIFPGAVVGSLFPSVVWTDRDQNPNTVGVTSKSYTVSLGAPGPSRYMIVGIKNPGGLSNVKIAGVTATLIVSDSGGDTFLYGAAVPTGTSGAVTWTSAVAINTECLGVWAAYNLRSTTAYDTSSVTNDNSAPTGFNCNTPNRGILIAFSNTYSISPTAPTATMTGVTEDFDVRPWRDAYCGGSLSGTTAETPRTVSVNWTTTSGAAGVAASFR